MPRIIGVLQYHVSHIHNECLVNIFQQLFRHFLRITSYSISSINLISQSNTLPYELSRIYLYSMQIIHICPNRYNPATPITETPNFESDIIYSEYFGKVKFIQELVRTVLKLYAQ